MPGMACLLCSYKNRLKLQHRLTLRVPFLRECGYVSTAVRTDDEMMSSQEEREYDRIMMRIVRNPERLHERLRSSHSNALVEESESNSPSA